MDDDQLFPLPTRRKIQQHLLRWFSKSARTLPWRGTRDLYRIWVSEIMLQQTQVATVQGYYERFLARFPTVADLAQAAEHDVLRLWEGLGYYRRARQLHKAAQTIVQQHEGTFPENFDAVLNLPGIGRYTSGAILSIGRDQRWPILEANTIRLLSRLTALHGDTSSTLGQRHLWQAAEELLPKKLSGQFNQALMELGALICTPRQPKCEHCPIKSDCAAFARGLQEQIPASKKRSLIESVREAAVVLRRRDGRILLRLRTPQERWAGMWDFPRFSLTQPAAVQDSEVRSGTQRITGHTPETLRQLTTIKHGVTRFRINLMVLEGRVNRVRPTAIPKDTEFRWIEAPELTELALSITGRKIARLLA